MILCGRTSLGGGRSKAGPPLAFVKFHLRVASILCRISTILAPCFCLAGTALGVEYFVSTTGLNSNPGTLAQPWLTIQKAADTVVAGDVVQIRAGTYHERVTISERDGTLALPIIFQHYAGDAGAAVIDQTGVTPPNGTSALLTIQNSDHILVRDLELANYKTVGSNTQQRAQLPAGIFITGDGNGIQILGCKVHEIWQSSATLHNFDANGFGIAAYGTAGTPIDNLVIDDCEVYALRTGASESVVLNGNVTNFRVTNNRVHDCNNIGIDFIGFEGTNTNPALDQARGGLCSGNEVYKIDSKFNPAYGGNFTTGGSNDTRSAPGLYVDGGKDIILERNHVHDCNFAVSVGSENQGKIVTGVTVRNNILHHCHVGGIVMGGSGTDNGGTENCDFSHNTIYDNDTVAAGGGQVSIQNHVANITIMRNLIASTADFAQLVLKDSATGSIHAGAIDWNLYRIKPGADLEFYWNGTSQSSFAAWQSASGTAKDAHSSLITTSLGLVNPAPINTSPASDFALTSSSPARDAGDSAALPFVAANGEKDYFGQSRVAGGRVDIGADEYLSSWQAWRDLYFSLPDGGGDADADADPDLDGLVNRTEYGLVLRPDASSQPPSAEVLNYPEGKRLRMMLSRDPARSDVTIEVRAAGDLTGAWTTVATSTLGAPFTGPGYVGGDDATTAVKLVEIRDIVNLSDATRRFLRVKVSQ